VCSGLLIEELGDELLVFDKATNRAHSLNATAVAVFRACDGKRSAAQIAEHAGVEQIAVELALGNLADSHLLAAETVPADRISRRSALRRLARAGAVAAVAVPVVRSITAPSAAMAGSVPNPGGSCTGNGDCGPASSCHSDGICHSSTCTPNGSFAPYACQFYPCCYGLTCTPVSAEGEQLGYCV
jgi:hypothetical protein